MKLLKTKKGIALLAVVAVAAISAIGAYAYWTQGGTGVGSATAGDTTAVTVVQDSTTASNLYPGGPAEDLSGHFTNPNASPVNIASVTAEVTSITGAGTADTDHPACSTADFEIGGDSDGPYTALADDSTEWSGLTISLKETGLNQDTCKGATAHVTYTANAGV
jgi:hypothetical protein